MISYSLLEENQIHILYSVLHTSNLTAINKVKTEIRDKLHIDLDNENIVETLSAEQISKLKKYEREQLNLLLSIIINEYPDSASYFAEFQDAINPTVERIKVNRFKKWVGIICLVLSFGYISALTWVPVPEMNIRFADTSLGVILGTVIAQILGYFFGRDDAGHNTNTVNSKLQQEKE